MTEDKSFVLEYYIPDHPSVKEDKANIVPENRQIMIESHIQWEEMIKNHYTRMRNSDRFSEFPEDIQLEVIERLSYIERIEAKVKGNGTETDKQS